MIYYHNHTSPLMSSARLVWITPQAQEQIVYCARVSNPKSQEEGKSPERLLAYLIKHKHWSPFEMASMCVEINTTRDIAAQILRHRSFSFQEFSQRYSDVVATFGEYEPIELRYQDTTNKQNSIEDPMGGLDAKFGPQLEMLYKASTRLYQAMVEEGVAKECARKVLLLQAPSRLYMSGTLRSWIHYCQIRTGPETQKEHRLIAQAIANILIEQCPAFSELLCNSPKAKPSASSLQLQQDPSIMKKPVEYWTGKSRSALTSQVHGTLS